jgi:hypothetical protein
MVQQHQSSRLAWALALLFCTAIIAGCSESPPIAVTSHYGAGIKFTGLGSTFAWAATPPLDAANALLGSPEFRQLVHSTVEKELAAKGFRLSSGGPLISGSITALRNGTRPTPA